MKCHYEVLEVSMDVNNEDLKKAYRKAALKWHPDKNLDNAEYAKEQFQLVQQAYEVLNDAHERAWYDSHRDAILKGGLGDDYIDDSFDIYPFFSATCYNGYGDDEKGFYSVYQEAFKKIAAEELEFMQDGDSDFEIPHFGDSMSDFKEIVQPFYAYWQNFTTNKSFSWLDQYDIRDLPNRRVAKLVEKDNKKIRDKAKKERNEAIRNLVSFVHKRDRRVKAQAKVIEQQAADNARKAAERRRAKLREKQQELRNFKECEWSKFSNFEDELKNIEKSLQAEYGDSDVSSNSDIDQSEGGENKSRADYGDIEALYCPACQKLFKTVKAFANHENSKKHRENLEQLRETLLEEDAYLEGEEEEDEVNEEGEVVEEEEGEEELTEEEEEVHNVKKEDILHVGADIDCCNENIADEVERETLNEDDKKKRFNTSIEASQSSSDSDDCGDSDKFTSKRKLKRKNQKQNKSRVFQAPKDASDGEEADENAKYSMMSKKQRRKMEQQQLLLENLNKNKCKSEEIPPLKEDAWSGEDTQKCGNEDLSFKSKGKSAKEARRLKRMQTTSSQNPVLSAKVVNDFQLSDSSSSTRTSNSTTVKTEHTCVRCSLVFPSKNKLFDHLKKTGHSVYVPKTELNIATATVAGKKPGKGRKK